MYYHSRIIFFNLFFFLKGRPTARNVQAQLELRPTPNNIPFAPPIVVHAFLGREMPAKNARVPQAGRVRERHDRHFFHGRA